MVSEQDAERFCVSVIQGLVYETNRRIDALFEAGRLQRKPTDRDRELHLHSDVDLLFVIDARGLIDYHMSSPPTSNDDKGAAMVSIDVAATVASLNALSLIECIRRLALYCAEHQESPVATGETMQGLNRRGTVEGVFQERTVGVMVDAVIVGLGLDAKPM